MVAVVDSGEKWGMFMLMGEYHHTIDDKGRIIIPSKFRDDLGEEFIITRGLENCLFVYPKDKWNSIVNKSVVPSSFAFDVVVALRAISLKLTYQVHSTHFFKLKKMKNYY